MSNGYNEFIYKKPDNTGMLIRYKEQENSIDFIVFEVEFADFDMNEEGNVTNYTIENEKELYECNINRAGKSHFHFAHGIEFESPKDYGAFVDVLNQLYGLAEQLLGEKADFNW